jgi:repressor LexA
MASGNGVERPGLYVFARTPSDERRPLTRQQRVTYDALVDYLREHGYPPSVRELADILGLASTSSVTGRLHGIRDRGWIRIAHNQSRAITVVDA